MPEGRSCCSRTLFFSKWSRPPGHGTHLRICTCGCPIAPSSPLPSPLSPRPGKTDATIRSHTSTLLVVLLFPASALMWVVSGSALVFLALLGTLGARAGGASVITAAVRVTFWGAMAMALTAGVGALFGVSA